MRIKYLNGPRLYHAFIAGGEGIIEQEEYLNKINVFPVADSDTGTNLASTMRSIIEGSRTYQSITQTFRSIADSALLGARGNSGIIFAQFIHGISREIDCGNRIDVECFAVTAKKAMKYVYESILEPVEGTMITVIKDWVDALVIHSKEHNDFATILVKALQVARESLRDTQKKLRVLAEAGVVDAGAKGFVDFLEGIYSFINHGKLKNIRQQRLFENFYDRINLDIDENTDYRYCSECIIKDFSYSVPEFRHFLGERGNSVILAGSPDKLHLHIHTNDPAELFGFIKQYGKIVSIKVDDMKKQYEVGHNRKYEIGLVTDSACDLPAELIEKYQIQQIPFSIIFGDNQFLDKITIDAQRFYRMLHEGKVHPRSSQPSPQLLQNFYSFYSSHYEKIIAVHISDKLTGIYNATLQVTDNIKDKTIKVFNSRQLTVSQGLIVMRIAEAIDRGWEYERIIAEIENWIDNSRIYVDVNTLKYMVRGGRV
ncbi:MAG: DegV family EDD domain-containing protein, partial [Candidatus Cloacimonetes bacterium]|nr:DegV family EDD domain-containing protein [Candidatus Cloacimonadota bacterium]